MKPDRLLPRPSVFCSGVLILLLASTSFSLVWAGEKEVIAEKEKREASNPESLLPQNKRNKCKLRGYRAPFNKPPYNREEYNRCLKMHEYFKKAEQE